MAVRPPASRLIPTTIMPGVPSLGSSLTPSPVKFSATTIRASGAIRSPASSGPYPRTSCRCWVSRNIDPPRPNATRMPPDTAPMNRLLRKKCMSSIGFGMRSSHSAKTARPTTPTAAEASTRPESQPLPGPEMIAKTTPTMPIMESSAPTRSGRSPLELFDSGTSRSTATKPMSATGMLIRNSEPHQ